MQYEEDEDTYEDEEHIACTKCGVTIYDHEPCMWTREGDTLCEHCSAGLVEVRYAHYHEDGVHFDTCVAHVPADEVVTLYLQIYLKTVVAGITLPPYISTRRYDATNLPDFVEFHAGAYRYVPGRKVKF